MLATFADYSQMLSDWPTWLVFILQYILWTVNETLKKIIHFRHLNILMKCKKKSKTTIKTFWEYAWENRALLPAAAMKGFGFKSLEFGAADFQDKWNTREILDLGCHMNWNASFQLRVHPPTPETGFLKSNSKCTPLVSKSMQHFCSNRRGFHEIIIIRLKYPLEIQQSYK